jgi:hypothetical protein
LLQAYQMSTAAQRLIALVNIESHPAAGVHKIVETHHDPQIAISRVGCSAHGVGAVGRGAHTVSKDRDMLLWPPSCELHPRESYSACALHMQLPKMIKLGSVKLPIENPNAALLLGPLCRNVQCMSVMIVSTDQAKHNTRKQTHTHASGLYVVLYRRIHCQKI